MTSLPIDLPGLYRGIASLRRLDNGDILPCRLPETAASLYTEAPQQLRCRCTSGVRIVLRTDATELHLDYAQDEGARPACCFALEVEGFGICRETDPAAGTASAGTLVFPLPGSSWRTVTLHLPHLRVVRLRRLSLNPGSRWQELPQTAPRLMVLGDSIAQGMTTTTPCAPYATALARHFGWELDNWAVGGATMQAPLLRQAASHDRDFTLVAYGVNDCNKGVPLDRFMAETLAGLQALTAGGSPVWLFTPIPWLAAPAARRLDDYRACLTAAAAAIPGVTLFDGLDAMPADPSLFVDGCHPNDAGNSHIFDYFRASLHDRHLLQEN